MHVHEWNLYMCDIIWIHVNSNNYVNWLQKLPFLPMDIICTHHCFCSSDAPVKNARGDQLPFILLLQVFKLSPWSISIILTVSFKGPSGDINSISDNAPLSISCSPVYDPLYRRLVHQPSDASWSSAVGLVARTFTPATGARYDRALLFIFASGDL